MDAREYFAQVPELKNHIKRVKEKIIRYRDISASPRSPSLEQHYNPNPNTASPFEKLLLEISELEQELDELQKIYNILNTEAKYILCQLDDDNERLTLQHRYLEGMSYIDIADELYRSERSVYRYEEAGLRHIIIPENHIEI